MWLKKLLVCFLAAVLLISSPTSVMAADNNESAVSPCNLYTNQVITKFTISSAGTANLLTRVSGYESLTTRVSVYVYLQKYQNGTWKTINSCSQATSASSLTLTKSVAVEKGYRYRMKVSSYVYSGSDSENIVKYSVEAKY